MLIIDLVYLKVIFATSGKTMKSDAAALFGHIHAGTIHGIALLPLGIDGKSPVRTYTYA